jgi:hypothetical protein
VCMQVSELDTLLRLDPELCEQALVVLTSTKGQSIHGHVNSVIMRRLRKRLLLVASVYLAFDLF